MPALDHVAVVCVLLGSASGTPEGLRELHGPRLEMLLRRLLDTTMHGVLYETTGSVPSELLASGTELVRRECERFRIPYELLAADPVDHKAWLAAALAAVERLISFPAR